MNPYIQWALYSVASGCVAALLTGVVILIHGGIKKVEHFATDHLPPAAAQDVNAFLDTIDRLAETVVQDANNRLVIAMKQDRKFTPDLGAAIKQDAINTVMANLGDLKAGSAVVLGDLEPIIGQYIEKHVLMAKGQTSMSAKTPA